MFALTSNQRLTVRDVAWHPYHPEIVSTSVSVIWIIINKFQYTCVIGWGVGKIEWIYLRY